MRKLFLVMAIVFFYNSSIAQEQDTYNYEIEIGHDNDFFLLVVESDRYYTYGINSSFRWKNEKEHFFFKKNKNYQNHYNQIRLNIEAYTPNYLADGSADDTEERPYAGWSYAAFSQTVAFTESYLRLGVDVGVLGPDSKAGEIQNWFHRLIDDVELQGWENQLPNQLGINLRGTYGFPLYESGSFDVFGTVDASLGNIYIYALPMINARLGKFNDIQNSISQNNQIMAPKSQIEYFLNIGIGAKASAYNATIQGNIFQDNHLFTQSEINNFVFSSYVGLNTLYKRFSFKLRYNVATGTLNSSDLNRYGALSLGYRF